MGVLGRRILVLEVPGGVLRGRGRGPEAYQGVGPGGSLEALGAPGGSLGVKGASWGVLGSLRGPFGGVLEAHLSLFLEVNLHTV